MLSFPAGFGYNSSDKRVKPANEKAVFSMNYHIGNMLIYQEFNGTGVCPLCRIRNILENRLADQYMSESVMEDFQRRLVNEKGFCEHHTKMLYARQGKLSLALQHTTRLTALKGKLEITADLKRAKAMAETFIHSGDTCVICDSVETNMIRYYKTVAEMFFAEPKFKETLLGTNGFCLEHFGYLLKYAAYARGKKKDYVYTLTKLQKESMDALLADLQWFCAKHDYRNADKPWNGADTALLRSVEKLHGETADEAPKK